jgi:hypothetical protein
MVYLTKLGVIFQMLSTSANWEDTTYEEHG